jgi:hypothetical protein
VCHARPQDHEFRFFLEQAGRAALCMCFGSWTQTHGKHHLIQDVRPPILSLFKRACIQVTKRGCGTTGCTGKRPTDDSDLLANRKDHGGGYALSSIMGTLTNLTGAGRYGNTPVYHASFWRSVRLGRDFTNDTHATTTPIACKDIVCHILSRYAWLL